MSSTLPVLVVGAGPAGCAAAQVLARRGHAVELIERGEAGRDKVCGDVLLPEARALMERLGLDTAVLKDQAHLVTGCAYHSPSGRRVELPFVDRHGAARPWWIVPRRQLDQRLADHAAGAGVIVRRALRVVDVWAPEGRVQGVLAQHGDGSRSLCRGRAVIAADGASSTLARALGRFERHPAHLSVALRAYVDTARGDDDLFSVFTTRHSLPGCGWIVPLGQGRANIGVGVIARDLKRHGLSLRDVLHDVAAQHPVFAQVFRQATRFAGWSLPGSTWPMPRVAPGILFAGDAANLVDPFTGHGIHIALDSGRRAGEVLAEALDDGDLSAARLERYAKQIDARWGAEARLGQILQRATSRAWGVERAMARIARGPRRRAMCGGLIGHCDDRASMLRALMLALLATDSPSQRAGRGQERAA